jgi:hypothetical protein
MLNDMARCARRLNPFHSSLKPIERAVLIISTLVEKNLVPFFYAKGTIKVYHGELVLAINEKIGIAGHE